MTNYKAVNDYKLTFYQNNKIFCSMIIASTDGVQAEITGRIIAGEGMTVKAERC